MPIRPKAMPRLHVEISDCMETTLHVFFVCNPQMTWGVSLYCFHDLSSGSSLMMYKDMQGCTKLCNAHNQIIGCRKKHCTKTNACQRILSLQNVCGTLSKTYGTSSAFLCTCSVHKSTQCFRFIRNVLLWGMWKPEVKKRSREPSLADLQDVNGQHMNLGWEFQPHVFLASL